MGFQPVRVYSGGQASIMDVSIVDSRYSDARYSDILLIRMTLAGPNILLWSIR